MDQSLELTRLSESYCLNKQRGGPQREASAAQQARGAKGKPEEDAMCCHLYVPARTTLFVGCTSGTLLLWKPKNEFHAEIVRTELGVSAGGHRGRIFDLLFLGDGEWGAGGGSGYGGSSISGGSSSSSAAGNSPHMLLATCSADRTVKLWDVFDRELPLQRRCIQTLVGHAGSVTSLSFIRGALITASTDGSVRVWRSAPERSLLLYPFFECVQELWGAPPPVPNSVLSNTTLGVAAEVASQQAIRPGKGTVQLNERFSNSNSGGSSGSGVGPSTITGQNGIGSGPPVLKSCPTVIGRLSRAETQLLFVGDAQGRVYTFTPPARTFNTTPSVLNMLSASTAERPPRIRNSEGSDSDRDSAANSARGPERNHSRSGSAQQQQRLDRENSLSAPGPHHAPSLSMASNASALSGVSITSGVDKGFGPFDFVRSHKIHSLSVSSMLLVASESLIVTLSFDHTCAVHDAITGAGCFSLENPTRARYLCAAWDRKNQELFLGDARGFLQVWNVYLEKCIKSLRLREGPITSLSLHGENGDRMLLGHSAGIEVWSIRRNVKYNEFKGHEGPVVQLLQVKTSSLSSVDAELLQHNREALEKKNSQSETAGGGGAGAESASGGGALTKRTSTSPKRRGSKGGGRGKRTGILTSILSEESYLYSCSLDFTVRQWDSSDMVCLSILQERHSELSAMAYLPGSIILCTGHDDGTVRMWNMDSGTFINLHFHRNTVSALVVARTGRGQDCLLSCSFDGTLACWDVTKGAHRSFSLTPEYSRKISEEEVLCACFHSGRGTVYTSGNDMVIQGFHLDSRTRDGSFKGHTSAVGALALDGDFLLSGSDDGSIRVWSIHHHYCLAVMKGHELAVRDLVVLPLSGLVASCSFDGKVLLWDYQKTNEEGKEVFRAKSLVEDAGAAAGTAGGTAAAMTPAPASAASSSLGLDGNTGLGCCILQFHHLDRRFRCLLYDASQRKIFAGTEENRIMLFQLPDEIFAARGGKGAVGGAAESQSIFTHGLTTPAVAGSGGGGEEKQQSAEESKENVAATATPAGGATPKHSHSRAVSNAASLVDAKSPSVAASDELTSPNPAVASAAPGAADAAWPPSSLLSPDMNAVSNADGIQFIDYSLVVSELLARSKEIQQALAVVKPLPQRPNLVQIAGGEGDLLLAQARAQARSSMNVAQQRNLTVATGVPAAAGSNSGATGATTNSNSGVGGGRSAAAALKRMSTQPAVAAPAHARRASLTGAQGGVAAFLKANALASAASAASPAASAAAAVEDEKDSTASLLPLVRSSRPSARSTLSKGDPLLAGASVHFASNAAAAAPGMVPSISSHMLAIPGAVPAAVVPPVLTASSVVEAALAFASAAASPSPGASTPGSSPMSSPASGRRRGGTASSMRRRRAAGGDGEESGDEERTPSSQHRPTTSVSFAEFALSDTPTSSARAELSPDISPHALPSADSSVTAGDASAPAPDLAAAAAASSRRNTARRFSMPSSKGRLQFDV